MGMGLAISRTIIEGHNGQIWLQRELTEGAVFHVELPLREPVRGVEEVDVVSNPESLPATLSATDEHAVVQGA
jgi:hypothetical protein